jgi:hypothetical protein
VARATLRALYARERSIQLVVAASRGSVHETIAQALVGTGRLSKSGFGREPKTAAVLTMSGRRWTAALRSGRPPLVGHALLAGMCLRPEPQRVSAIRVTIVAATPGSISVLPGPGFCSELVYRDAPCWEPAS